MNEMESIKKDFQAFADDENDVIIEPNGDIMITRFDKEIICKLQHDASGNKLIEINGDRIPYRKFIAINLANLDIFAQKVLAKQTPIDHFINGLGELESVEAEKKCGPALDLLLATCGQQLPFATKVIFLTADAGHGKTYLLRKLQNDQAKKFLETRSTFLLWHVDLQGRQLLRLNEALMGSLGDLRITGLYMQSIITLIRHKLLVLAIDGFDELAAEQGSSDALGALSHLVKMLRDTGSIVAAARRTFFDAEEYMKRTRLLSSIVSSHSQYDQLSLMPWRKEDAINFLSVFTYENNRCKNPEKVYQEIFVELNKDDKHPLLSRPFLLTQIAKALLYYDIDPALFIKRMQNPLEGVSAIVDSFIEREVTEKWKLRETGEPYLSQAQHTTLLAVIAEEMWYSQKERLNFELIQDILSVLLDEWDIQLNLRPQIVEMVKMHVLLVPDEFDFNYRKFEHPEFKNYFISQNLYELLNVTKTSNGKLNELRRFLSIAQLPDSVAKYTASRVEKTPSNIRDIIHTLESLAEKEWKPTYLNTNIGTILPYLINAVNFDEIVSFNAKLVFSSLVFENTNLKNFHFEKGQFINCRFVNINWENITFENCNFQDAVFDYESMLRIVNFRNCDFTGVILCKNGEEFSREYSPQRIIDVLSDIGFNFVDKTANPIDDFDLTNEKKIILKFFRIFRKTTRVTDKVLVKRFQPEQQYFVFNTLIPLAEESGIITEVKWRGGGSGRAWLIKVRAEDFFQAQQDSDETMIGKFWKKIRTKIQNR